MKYIRFFKENISIDDAKDTLYEDIEIPLHSTYIEIYRKDGNIFIAYNNSNPIGLIDSMDHKKFPNISSKLQIVAELIINRHKHTTQLQKMLLERKSWQYILAYFFNKFFSDFPNKLIISINSKNRIRMVISEDN